MNNWITFKNTSGTTLLSIIPSECTWSLMSVNAANSGRDSKGTMYTNRVTQKRKLDLSFWGVTHATASRILQAVNDEYFQVTYPDMLSGGMETRTFYVGDREAPVYVWWDGQKVLSSLSFSVIER